MPQLFIPRTELGPIVWVGVGYDGVTLGEFQNRGETAPAPLPVPLLIDTGASISSVPRYALDYLESKASGTFEVLTAGMASTVETRDIYQVAIYITAGDGGGTTPHRTINVTEYHSPNGAYDGLLGWDVLRHLDFNYSAELNSLMLSF